MNTKDAGTILNHAQQWLGFTAANDLHEQAAAPENLHRTWEALPEVVEYIATLETLIERVTYISKHSTSSHDKGCTCATCEIKRVLLEAK